MSAQDNKDNRDFIDKIFDVFEPYKKSGVRFFALTVLFLICFIGGFFMAPQLISVTEKLLPFPVTLYQLSPFEVFYNYAKIAFFISTFITLPFAVYQFGKLKVEKLDFDNRLNLLFSASSLALIILVSFGITLKFIFPAEIVFLYGLNTDIATISSSLSAMVSSVLMTMILLIILILLPLMKKIIKKSLFFNYATLIKFKKPVIVYAAILAGIITLPLELIGLVLSFVVFYLWYKVLIHFAKKPD